VHCQHAGFPILGDAKYAGGEANITASTIGLQRLFLHAKVLKFEVQEQRYNLHTELAEELQSVLRRMPGL
jgi:23S rRNA pseudouridine955/2504/2580 synthase